ncbi:hypothetical protein VCRA2110O2_30248 [Vibrio crassostreae]|nr:hypothetical protein VCHA44O286_50127 [Vibrio chagasii]CAK2865276.1 hypothetical protein VCRA2110O2_30248 [Vibrio crassostreae]
MKAIAIFERRDDENVFLFPVLIDVDLTPADRRFDLFDYKGRAYQALSDVDYTDSENAISDAATSPALDAIIPFDPAIPLGKWKRIKSSMKCELITSLLINLYTTDAMIEHTGFEVPDGMKLDVSIDENGKGVFIKVTCDSSSIHDIQKLNQAHNQYNSFVRSERYSTGDEASVMTTYFDKAFKE